MDAADVCVCMYICLYIRSYICTYVCMYVCMYIHMCMYIHVRTYVRMHACVFAGSDVRGIHTYVRMYVYYIMWMFIIPKKTAKDQELIESVTLVFQFNNKKNNQIKSQMTGDCRRLY